MAISKHETRFILSGKDQTKAALGSVKAGLKGISGNVSGLQRKLLALAGAAGFGMLLKGLIATNISFQTMKSSLKTVTGSAEAASKAFDQIEQFATSTPFELEEVVQSFIKLKALGLDPSEEAMRSYGNTASAMGKSLDQMIEAVADAARGELERLKEFGIVGAKQGDEIAFTFQNVTTTVKNNAAEITGYLQGIGNTNFAAAMSDQMKNIKTAFSNLSGELKSIQVDIGEAGLNDLIAGMANSTTDFLKSLDKEQIQAFTRAALSGLADVVDGVDAVANYIGKNPEFAEIGIVGFALFGKKGLAAVLAAQVLLEATAKATEMIGAEVMGNSSVTFGGQLADEIGLLKGLEDTLAKTTGPAVAVWKKQIDEQRAIVDAIRVKMEQLPNGGVQKPFQLGAFNDAAGPGSFSEWAGAIRDQQVKQSDPRLVETNTLLKEIAERIRDQSNVAVAG